MRSRQFAHTATAGLLATAWSRAARSSAASIARAAQERRTSKIVSDRCARSERRQFSLSYASIGSKLLSMPGLRHILDSRLAGVANQNEGQSVLVRAAELINAGAFARFWDGPRPARFLSCDSVTCDRVGSPDLCLWLRGHDVKCTVSIDRPHSSERVSPRARKRSRAGSRRGCAGGQQGH